MSDLLPPNATPQERALSASVSRLAAIPAAVRQVWNADTCPVALLPWLAWAVSVDVWDASWSEQQKRDTIKNSLLVHKRKGTIGGVREALAALGVTTQITEWFQQTPAGAPYTFKVTVESRQAPVDQSGIASVLAVIEDSKNLRSHINEITIVANSEARLFSGAVASTGNEITVSFGQPE